MHNYNNKIRGFSFMEIAIVVTIMAILLSVVISVNRFVENSKLQAVVSEVQNYKGVIKSFQEIYKFLPGDFPHADQFWGTDCAAIATHCNGDGDGFIVDDSGALDCTDCSESLLGWRHLQMANLVSEEYTGKKTTDNGCASNRNCCAITGANTNCPHSILNDGRYVVTTWEWTNGGSGVCGDTTHTYPTDVQALFLGGHAAADIAEDALMNPVQAFKIDSKIDDGIPTKGMVLTQAGQDELAASIGDCIVDNAGAGVNYYGQYGLDRKYNESATADGCHMAFYILEDIICELP